jgi:hypothetical protein
MTLSQMSHRFQQSIVGILKIPFLLQLLKNVCNINPL